MFFRCMYCGRFISYSDLDTGKAIHKMIAPDSALSKEEYETYHIKCEEREQDATINNK